MPLVAGIAVGALVGLFCWYLAGELLADWLNDDD